MNKHTIKRTWYGDLCWHEIEQLGELGGVQLWRSAKLTVFLEFWNNKTWLWSVKLLFSSLRIREYVLEFSTGKGPFRSSETPFPADIPVF
jgi:hypothetical protein